MDTSALYSNFYLLPSCKFIDRSYNHTLIETAYIVFSPQVSTI